MLDFPFNSGNKTINSLFCFIIFLAIIVIGGGNLFTSISLASQFNTELSSNQTTSGLSSQFGPIPSNISVHIEPKDTGTLYFSAIISNNTVDISRDLNDELYPFQLINWYQLIKFEPQYTDSLVLDDISNNELVVGELRNFDNFDSLLEQARTYHNVPINETFILDVPNKDVSFMLLKIEVPNGDSGIYYGLYDGNQQIEDKSEVNLRLNPESSLKMPESESAIEIKNDAQLFNLTKTFVCNDLYKLGYERCQ